MSIPPNSGFSTAKWIVSATPGYGTHTTIGAAMTAASAGDTIFIRTGTYTENVTLKASVNLTSFPSEYIGNVLIVGEVSASFSGGCTIAGLGITTNGSYALSVTGSNATTVEVIECSLEGTNNTPIQFTSSSSSSSISLINCLINTGTTGIAYHTMSSPGTINYIQTITLNSGSSLSAATNSAGDVAVQNCSISGAFETSGTGSIQVFNSAFTTPLNLVMLTCNGTGAEQFSVNSSYFTGVSSAISVGTGATLVLTNATVFSDGTNAITGLGTLEYGSICFTGSSSVINTTTQIPITTRPGFSTKNQVFTSSGSYTPTLGMVECQVTCIGAGGGGGGAPSVSSQFAPSGGGGGGEYAVGIFSASTVGSSQTVSIGAAGTGGTAGASGGTGGASSLGSLITANGGAGGASSTASSAGSSAYGGVGGSGGSGGDYRTAGSVGGNGLSVGLLYGFGGTGASTQLGAGGAGTAVNSTGAAANGYGSGGGGTIAAGTNSGFTGGAGAKGVIVIQEYILS